MRVLSNPFSAEYGGFSSAVIEVTTRGGGVEWKWLFEDPSRTYAGSITAPMASKAPRRIFAFFGPVIRDKLYLFQSLYHGCDTIRTPSLPNPTLSQASNREAG
jgi:hypothetical protein